MKDYELKPLEHQSSLLLWYDLKFPLNEKIPAKVNGKHLMINTSDITYLYMEGVFTIYPSTNGAVRPDAVEPYRISEIPTITVDDQVYALVDIVDDVLTGRPISI